MEGNTTTTSKLLTSSTMMHSVALDQSTVYPDDDDDYVVVEFSKPTEPSPTSPLLEGISDDEDEDEYDYCDDIENESSGPMQTSNIEQSISFEEVSDRLYSTSKFFFGEEADQLMLELDTSASFLHESSENEEISSPSAGSPVISSSPSHYDNATSGASVENEEDHASAAETISSQSDGRNHSHSTVDSELEETRKPALTWDAPAEEAAANEKPRKKLQERKPEPPQQHSNTSSVSRLTNKKRRKQMKLAKKAAAAAAAAASLGHISTMGSHHSHHSIGSSSASHPSHRVKTNVTAMKAPPRGKNKKQVAPSSIAVACATQSLAEYRLELQSHHRNGTATTTTVTNKLVR